MVLLPPRHGVAGESPSPTTLYYNGQVFTAAAKRAEATWFVVREGRFLEVGKSPGIPAKWAKADEQVDLAGRFVMPSLVDAHLHFVDGGLSLLQTDLAEVKTRAQLAAALNRAQRHRLGGWVLARNLDLAPFGGHWPTHGMIDSLLGSRPAYVALKTGHHVYVNRAGLAVLGIDSQSPDPPGGTILRDAQGQPTGVLVDEAAWSAQRRVYQNFPPRLIAQAILQAQRLALRYGITAIGDNTFYPNHAMQFWRLREAGRLVLRVAMRSFGPVEETRFLMRNIGVDFIGNQDDSVRYFGVKHFVDESLSVSADDRTKRPVPGGKPRMSVAQLRDVFLYAGPYGTAFHTQSYRGVKRLLAARRAVGRRRAPELLDVIDHCGSCGGSLPRQIRAAGFKLTLLPGQLHELPQLAAAYTPTQLRRLLRFRDLFAAGLQPALTSDWPFAAPPPYPSTKGHYHRFALAPLPFIAVATSGRTPTGKPIAHAKSRTISMARALKGYTIYGARAIGRGEDLGRIAPGYWADFILLPTSPFDVAPVSLYRMKVDATYVAGRQVYNSRDGRTLVGRSRPRTDAAAFGGTPVGWTPSPVIGYAPSTGLILGGAFFFYPYEEHGLLGNVQLMVLPQQSARFQASLEASYLRAWPKVDVNVKSRFGNIQGLYYGMGNDTRVVDEIETDPAEIDAELGVAFNLSKTLKLGVDGLYGLTREKTAAAMLALGTDAEGTIDGHRAGARLSLQHDTRDSLFSSRFGGLRELWLDGYWLQGSQASGRARLGLRLSQFVPLYAPDWVLALRGEGAVSFGQYAYDTNFALGGIRLLRGYYDNRFRGHHYAAAGAEVRFPIWLFISGAAFGEAGMTWVDGRENSLEYLAWAGGGGLRFGLPPDFLIKLRFDAGFGRDQWGLFFNFNEAF